MANPQLENGYVRIANEITEALMTINLSAYQHRIIWAVIRKTWGYKKKFDRVANNQISEMTGIHKTHVSRTVKELILMNIVTRMGNKIGINKDYESWQKLPRSVTSKVTPIGNKVTPIGNKKLPQLVTTKDNKDNKEKEMPPYQKIIEYFNSKSGKKFNHKIKVTRSHINARWNEGFRLKDFCRVIDIKCNQWLSDPKMIGYLRPQTLFGTKFESYLNERNPSIEDTSQPAPSYYQELK